MSSSQSGENELRDGAGCEYPSLPTTRSGRGGKKQPPTVASRKSKSRPSATSKKRGTSKGLPNGTSSPWKGNRREGGGVLVNTDGGSPNKGRSPDKGKRDVQKVVGSPKGKTVQKETTAEAIGNVDEEAAPKLAGPTNTESEKSSESDVDEALELVGKRPGEESKERMGSNGQETGNVRHQEVAIVGRKENVRNGVAADEDDEASIGKQSAATDLTKGSARSALSSLSDSTKKYMSGVDALGPSRYKGLDTLVVATLNQWTDDKFQLTKYLNKRMLDRNYPRNLMVQAQKLAGISALDESEQANASRRCLKNYLRSRFNQMRDYYVQRIKRAILKMRKYYVGCGVD